MKTNIVVAGEWKSLNLGDEIICKTFVHLLGLVLSSNHRISELDISLCKMNFFERVVRKILDILNKSLAIRYLQHIRARSVSKETKKILDDNVAFVVFPGGALFQEYFADSMKSVVVECQKRNIPIFYNACGSGPNNQRTTKIFQWVLRQPCVNIISTRDDLSKFTQKDITIVPDVAIMACEYYNFKIIRQNEQKIGINIIAPEYYLQHSNDNNLDRNHFDKRVIEMIHELSGKYKISLFSNGALLDHQYLEWIYSQINRPNVVKETRPLNGFELSKTISQYSLVIGFRLHSLITAYSYSIPTIGIAWDEKVYKWNEMIGNINVFKVSNFPISEIKNICELSICNGINVETRKKLEKDILFQIKKYQV